MIFESFEFEKVIELCSEKHIICFAMGIYLSRICEMLSEEQSIDIIVDNNSEKWGQEYIVNNKCIKIVSPNELSGIVTENSVLLITTTYYKQVIEQLKGICGLDKLEKVYYFPNKGDILFNEFAERHKNESLKDIVVFRSGNEKFSGWDFNDNAKAVFDYMLGQGYNKKYKLVWMVKYPERYKEYLKYDNVEFVSYDWETSDDRELSDKYHSALYFGKFFLFTDVYFWLRNCRDGQLRINLWHGCGFKDRKVKSNGDCGKHYEYMTVNSPMYAQIHAEEYGCRLEQMLITGMAKQDLLFKESEINIFDLLEIKKTSKCIFWLPTFRKALVGLESLNEYELISDTGLPIVVNDEMMEELDSLLGDNNVTLIIKLHPQDGSVITDKIYNNIVVLENAFIIDKGFQINSLLSQADAVISDYSSVAVDYMLLDRPIAFTLDDVEEYQSSRGFVFNPIRDYLPGVEIYNFEQFKEFVVDIADGKDNSADKRRELMKKMHTYTDGENCKRILNSIGIEL